jgi:DNA-binding transcriptional ArsR family regulator
VSSRWLSRLFRITLHRKPVNSYVKFFSHFSVRELARSFVNLAVMSSPNGQGGSWTLLTGHGHVLVEIARNPQARMRDISAVVGLTERAVQAIVGDLESAGYVTRERIGRRNRYTVNPQSVFRHRAQAGLQVGPLLEVLTAAGNADQQRLETSSPGS